jgi:DNA-binding helix-hairpin-helix protein with protein kinase domain
MRDVFDLLQQQRNGHIQRFLESENNLNQAFDTQLETEKLINERNSQLERTSGMSVGLREGIKQLLDLDIEVAADRAALEVLEKAVIEKKSSKKDLEKESEILATKYKQIQHLQKQIVRKKFSNSKLI